MGSFLGKLFGTDEAVKGVIETGKELLDDAFYTDAETAADRAAAAAGVRDMVVGWMGNTQGQNLSRRVIALSVTGTWLSMYVIATIMDIGGVWLSELYHARLAATSLVLDTRNDSMTGAVMMILAFYFAAPKIGEIAEVAMSRFGKKP